MKIKEAHVYIADNKMSYSSSRRSQPVKQKVDDGEFFLECKAAYLSVFDDLADRIGSKKDLQTGTSKLNQNEKLYIEDLT